MKKNIKFVCKNCGAEVLAWSGQCPKCKEWGTIEEISVTPQSKGAFVSSSSSPAKLVKMKDVTGNEDDRIITGINEFDRVCGGGLVRDSVTILSAPPGTGKSTLCLMITDKMIGLGHNVLYASGEESATQIKNRAIRLKLKNIDNLWITDTTSINSVVKSIEEKDIDFIIADSIQTFYAEEYLPSRAGSPTQVIECANALRAVAKNDKKRTVIIIGQMTKDEQLAGLNSLQHLVDTYIKMNGDSDDTIRTLTSEKNRFGNTGETGFFNMTEHGLDEILNPSEYFMTERDMPVEGTALTVIKEGSRAVIAEIESLVSHSTTPYPSRIGNSLKKEQLNTLASILEQRADISTYDKNIIIKTSGGINLYDQSCNLAILMAIISSIYKNPIDEKTVFIADVGLTGELKKVQNLESRIKEIDRMGYKKVYVAKNSVKDKNIFKNVKVIECQMLKDVIRNLNNN